MQEQEQEQEQQQEQQQEQEQEQERIINTFLAICTNSRMLRRPVKLNTPRRSSWWIQKT